MERPEAGEHPKGVERPQAGERPETGEHQEAEARLLSTIPQSASPITVPDIEFDPPGEFRPLRAPGPYVPAGIAISASSLEFFSL